MSNTITSADPLSPIGAKILAKNGWIDPLSISLFGDPYKQFYTAVFLGDSLTQGSSDSAGLKQQYPVCVQMLSKGKIVLLRNAGVSGNTSAAILARVDTDVIPYAPDLCFIQGFSNDSLAATTDAATIANLSAVINKLVSKRIVPIFICAPPLSANTTNREAQERKNTAIKNWCQYNKITWIDPWSFVVDVTNGNWTASYTTDSTHPKPVYYRQMAQNVLSSLNLTGTDPDYAKSNTDKGNKVSNGMFLNGSSVPTGWNDVSGVNNCTLTIESGGSEVKGNYLVFTYGSGSTGARSISFSGPTTPGNIYSFSCKITATGVEAGVLDYNVILAAMDSGFSILSANKWRPAFNLFYDVTAGVLRGEWVAPVGASYFNITLSAGSLIGGVGVVKFAEVRLEDKTGIVPVSEYPWI